MLYNDSLDRYRKVDLLNLKDVENEIEMMMSIVNPDTMSDETFEYVNNLIGIAKSLGTRKEY